MQRVPRRVHRVRRTAPIPRSASPSSTRGKISDETEAEAHGQGSSTEFKAQLRAPRARGAGRCRTFATSRSGSGASSQHAADHAHHGDGLDRQDQEGAGAHRDRAAVRPGDGGGPRQRRPATSSGATHPLLEVRDERKRVVVISIDVRPRSGRRFQQQHPPHDRGRTCATMQREQGVEVELITVGKKAAGLLPLPRGRAGCVVPRTSPTSRRSPTRGRSPSEVIERLRGRRDRRGRSSSSTASRTSPSRSPEMHQLCPIEHRARRGRGGRPRTSPPEYLFEPRAETVLGAPAADLRRGARSTARSWSRPRAEQGARRTAMKSATDNAIRHDHHADPQLQPGAPGRDHDRDRGDRRWRSGAGGRG